MSYLNKEFRKAVNNKNYWRNFYYVDNFYEVHPSPSDCINPPIERGFHLVLVSFLMSDITIEMEANWNGCDWITRDGEEISHMVKGYKEKRII